MRSGGGFNRRSLLIGASATAGGLALGFAVPFERPRSAVSMPAAAAPEITCWLTIARDDTVTIRVAHSEMGQGVLTGLAMLVAEELECDWSKVRAQLVSVTENSRRNNAWGDTSTGASRSIASSQLYLRQAGATARDMLITAAAARWAVPAAQCTAHNSTITHAPSGRTLTFGAVAEEAASVEPSTDIRLKAPGDWKLAGTAQKRLDVRDKVTGQPVYAIDVRLPDMLYAAIVHCPVFKGTPKSVDESSIAGMKGVRRIVRMEDAVAVIADSWWRAKCAADALKVTWDDRGNGDLSSASIAQLVRGGLDAQNAQVGHKRGDAASALGGAVKRIEADYGVPFLAHATMEPQNCTAHVKPGSVEIWAPTQDPATAVATAALAAGVTNDQVTVHRMMLGGGFGRRAPIQEYVRQSVLIAKEVERAGQARLDARRGYQARSLSALEHGAACSRPRCRRHAGRFDDPPRRAVVRGVAGAGLHPQRRRLDLYQRARRRDGLRPAELSGRLRHPRHRGAARRLARHQLHAECVLQGKLHRRDGA